MTLIELEDQLKRMREQHADDHTPVMVVYGGESRSLKEVVVWVQQGHMGRRVVELIG